MEETARGKAREVAQRLKEREDWVVVVGADTVVVRTLIVTLSQRIYMHQCLGVCGVCVCVCAGARWSHSGEAKLPSSGQEDAHQVKPHPQQVTVHSHSLPYDRAA